MGLSNCTVKNYTICHTARLCISYASHNKHRLFSDITLSDLSLVRGRSMFREVGNRFLRKLGERHSSKR